MIQDPIVEDIHKIRRENAAKLNFHINSLLSDSGARKSPTSKMVSLPKRLLKKAG